VDNITTRVFRNDEGNGLLDDLLGLGTPISIGKTAALYRVSSDAGKVHRSLTGHVPEELDKVIYDEAGDPIPIFNTGYSREWREWNGMQSENLDAMADDQEAHVAAIREDMADYMLSGDAKVKVKGYVGAGITNHANTNQVDLSAPV
jgi:Fe-S cluster biosynthesis and repair protein YggX